MDWMIRTHVGEDHLLFDSTDLNANLIWEHPHRHTWEQSLMEGRRGGGEWNHGEQFQGAVKLGREQGDQP